MALKQMLAKWSGHCKTCGHPFSKEAPIYWSKETGALCVMCGEEHGKLQTMTFAADASLAKALEAATGATKVTVTEYAAADASGVLATDTGPAYSIVSAVDGKLVTHFQTNGFNGKSSEEQALANLAHVSESKQYRLTLWAGDVSQGFAGARMLGIAEFGVISWSQL